MTYSYLDCLAYLGVGGAHPGGLLLTENILLKEEIDETKSLLDVGCGTGQTAYFIAQQYGSSITGIDNNEIMIEKARKRCISSQVPISIKQGAAEALPFPDEAFDYVLLESVLSFTDMKTAILESKRVLKPHGVLLAIEMTKENNLPKEDVDFIMGFYGVSQLLTESEWRNAFQEIGFSSIDILKQEVIFDPHDLEHATDFIISENLDQEYVQLLNQHEQVTEHYRNSLGFRIIRCVK
ncbi:class I SAM-dependent methyltransferase [Ornithinibacillus xuwenensis]|uniref:Class I SAM-dependent methyltransferase n=1 Tax=Ornithinibacillus xuwenensis TaxID=3144668 RepID=A0ABU9XNK2_9BACI